MYILACNAFDWDTVKYPTSDLIFLSIHASPFGECVYKEKSSHEWDIHGILDTKTTRGFVNILLQVFKTKGTDGTVSFLSCM